MPKPKARAFRDSERYREHVRTGVCHYCLKPARPGKISCSVYIQSITQRSRQYRLNRQANNLCITCGERPTEPTCVRCTICILDQKLKRLDLPPDQMERVRSAFQTFKGECEICKTTDPGACGWRIDHCHLTKQFRGIICDHCNRALGFLRDCIETALAVADYLKVNQNVKN